MNKSKATLIGFSAVVLWALLALFTVASAPVPPFLLSALSFGIGGLVGVVWLILSGEFGKLRRVPLSAYAFGTAGLFGYHFLYFTALRMAPAAEAGLISYLWPLFIVLFSGLMPGESLRRGHVAGAVVAFLGAALIVASGVGAVSGAAEAAAGHAPGVGGVRCSRRGFGCGGGAGGGARGGVVGRRLAAGPLDRAVLVRWRMGQIDCRPLINVPRRLDSGV